MHASVGRRHAGLAVRRLRDGRARRGRRPPQVDLAGHLFEPPGEEVRDDRCGGPEHEEDDDGDDRQRFHRRLGAGRLDPEAFHDLVVAEVEGEHPEDAEERHKRKPHATLGEM